MKKASIAANLLLAAAVCTGNYYYHTIGGLKIKAACSAGFVLISLVNLVYTILRARKRLKFALPMAAGLILAMLGDIFLTFDFITGAALFAAGHICYFIAQCALNGLCRRDVTAGLLLSACAAALLLLYPGFFFRRSIIRNVCIIYAVIISMMTGKALSTFAFKRNPANLAIALGCALFFFSDLMLALKMFTYILPSAGVLCMATYYPAQCLLAGSIFLTANHASES